MRAPLRTARRPAPRPPRPRTTARASPARTASSPRTGSVHRRHVDADDRDRRPRPDARGEAAGADQRQPVEDRPELAELLLRLDRAVPLVAPQTLHRDVAAVVVERRDRAYDREQGVGRRASVLAAVLAGSVAG